MTSTTPAAMASWACWVEAPMWWVPTTRGCCASREVHSADPDPGSSAYTSRPARRSRRVEGLEQGVLVDEVAPRGVQQDGPALHPAEERTVDQAGRVRARGQVEGDDVAGREQLGQRLGHPDVQVLQREPGRARCGRASPAPRTSIPNARARWATSSPIEPSPRMPIVDAEQAARRAVGLLVPATGAEVDRAVDDPPVHGEQEAHRQLGHRDRVPAGQVGDQDPAGGGGPGVDRVRAGAGADDQGEPVGVLEDLATDLGAAHHQRVEPVEAARQVRCLQPGIDDAGVAARLELGDRRLADGVGKEHAHRDLRMTQSVLFKVAGPGRPAVRSDIEIDAHHETSLIMRNKRYAELLTRLVEHARYEVLPTPSTEETVLAHLPRDRVITVTASPGKGLDATLDLAERLAGHGYAAVPHLAARMVHGRAELAEISERLTGKGITRVFVPGGDAEPDGDYPDALSLLEDLAALGRPFAHVGIAGYPESHPTITDDLTVQSMWDKRRYATHVVSNLTFDPAAITVWVRRMRDRGDHDAVAARPAGAGGARQAAGDGHEDRRGGVHPVPGQAQGHARPAGRARRLHRRAVPRAVRTGAGRARCGSWRACTSSPSTRSRATEAWRRTCCAACRGDRVVWTGWAAG